MCFAIFNLANSGRLEIFLFENNFTKLTIKHFSLRPSHIKFSTYLLLFQDYFLFSIINLQKNIF